jgi:hypothetical protein
MIAGLIVICYLTALLASGLYNIDDRIINEYGTAGGIRSAAKKIFGENLPLCNFVH